MQYQQGDYTVVSAAPMDGAAVGTVATDVPQALRARLFGRRFTRQQLEEMGVEFRGNMAFDNHDGIGWELKLTPEL